MGRSSTTHRTPSGGLALIGTVLVLFGATGLTVGHVAGDGVTVPIALLGGGVILLLCSLGDALKPRRRRRRRRAPGYALPLFLIAIAVVGALVLGVADVRFGTAAIVVIFLVAFPLVALVDLVWTRQRSRSARTWPRRRPR